MTRAAGAFDYWTRADDLADHFLAEADSAAQAFGVAALVAVLVAQRAGVSPTQAQAIVGCLFRCTARPDDLGAVQ